MNTLTIDILDPSAETALNELASRNLIAVREQKEFSAILEKFREQANNVPSLEEITEEVEAVRRKRYEKAI